LCLLLSGCFLDSLWSDNDDSDTQQTHQAPEPNPPTQTR
jgi:hypothetical protein